MKFLKSYNESINQYHIDESIKDYLKPRSINDILKKHFRLKMCGVSIMKKDFIVDLSIVKEYIKDKKLNLNEDNAYFNVTGNINDVFGIYNNFIDKNIQKCIYEMELDMKFYNLYYKDNINFSYIS